MRGQRLRYGMPTCQEYPVPLVGLQSLETGKDSAEHVITQEGFRYPAMQNT